MLIIKPVEVKTILTICGMLAESSHNLTATRPSHTCCSSKTRAPSVTQRLSETGFFLFKTFYNEWKTIWHLWNVACLTLLVFFFASTSDVIMLVWQHAMRGWYKRCVSVSAYCIHVWMILAYLFNPHCLRTKQKISCVTFV